jgi:prepilin-type N-terminal cleavage/methylation domain-containing protein
MPFMNSLKKSFTFHLSPFISNKGVTIIELAVVLVILGILVGIGASMMGSLTKRAKLTETRETVNAAVDAVTG